MVRGFLDIGVHNFYIHCRQPGKNENSIFEPGLAIVSGIKYPLKMEIQFCTNKASGSIWSNPLG
jgi:hypothetical protein